MATSTDNSRYYKLGALSLAAGAGFFLLAWVFFFWLSIRNPLAGLDAVHQFQTRVTTLVPAVLIIAAHLAVAKTLLDAARTRR